MASKKLKVDHWPIDKIIEYARNPRKNDHAVDQVAAAIKEFGFRVPLIVKSDGLLIDGHLRLKAAKKLELTEVPVILADDMTDAQVKAFRINVNKMADLADWDNELLSLEFAELQELGFDTTLTGFDEVFVSKLITSDSHDDAPIKEIEGAKELSENDFSEFDHKCPRCGFEFDSKE